MDKVVLGLFLLIITGLYLKADSGSESSQYEDWKLKYHKNYQASEDYYRRAIFQQNLDLISSHNSNKSKNFYMEVNKFTGYSEKQFSFLFLSPKLYDPQWEETDKEFKKLGIDIDWSAKGMCSPVKDQGECGSCWAFSAVATLESFALMKGRNDILSEQMLVDCSRKYGNNGCSGGFNEKALAFVKDNGIASSTEYPYVHKNQICKMFEGSFKISSVPYVKGCPGLQTALQGRPIGAKVDANKWAHYAGGIFDRCNTHIDHDVLLVGYTDSYWKIKNSFGADWGESGYIRLAPGNTCGICQQISPWPE